MYAAVSHNITALKLDVESSLLLPKIPSEYNLSHPQAETQIAYAESRLSSQLNQATAPERSQKRDKVKRSPRK